MRRGLGFLVVTMLTLSWATTKPLRAHEDDDVREHGSIAGAVNVTPEQAQAEAQKVVTGKVVLSVELDNEHGAAVYKVRFDDGTEVKVDAATGVVMYVESPDDHNYRRQDDSSWSDHSRHDDSSLHRSREGKVKSRKPHSAKQRSKQRRR